jgi:hypothetical protein
MRSNRSFDTDTQRHCAARRAGERTPRAQCRCVPVNSDVRWQRVDDLQSPTQDHLRGSHAEERLRSFRSDRVEAWGVVGALVLLPLIYSWDMFPVMATLAAVLAAILLASTIVSVAWRKLFKRHREGID